ncbi:outer membrane protein [Yoonia sp. R2331]|uniref:outer membrane protein n=1 Tax=Yoonia sp. R2331 TaxID=3237238 RepID=UPI0034E57C1B
MKQRLLITSAALGFFAAPAIAGGITEPVMAPPPAPVAVAPAPVYTGGNWTGFYAGANLGYGQLNADGFSDDTEDYTYGVHAGYLYDLGSFVLGGELEYDATEITDAATGINLDGVARAKVRAGYDAGQWLPYVTAGAAQAYSSGALEADDTGYFAGLGVDYQVAPNIRLGAEVLQHQFDDFNGGGTDIEATTASVRVGFTF